MYSTLEFFHLLIEAVQETKLEEYIAVFAGIASVWFSSKENILVYPVGLISTVIYIYISFVSHLPGEAAVNLYYTIMSIYGWYMWQKKNNVSHQYVLQISFSSRQMWTVQISIFIILYAVLFFSLTFLKTIFFEGAIPWADAFASATAFTGMWLMAKKKVESWYWWIATNIASAPLYFIKGLALSSLLFVLLLIMAVWGLVKWRKKAQSFSKPATKHLQHY